MTPVNACMFLKLTKRLAHLLGRHIKILHSQVDLFVDVHAGNDKEHPRTTGTCVCKCKIWSVPPEAVHAWLIFYECVLFPMMLIYTFLPPESKRPSRKMTVRSYSF